MLFSSAAPGYFWLIEKVSCICDTLRVDMQGQFNGLKMTKRQHELPPLFDFQLQAVQFLLETPRAILRLDTGLGKTRTCIEYASQYQKQTNRPLSVLVFSPAYLKWNWWKEIETWSTNSHVSFSVESYGYVSRGKKIKEKYDLVICDEAHYLKSWASKRTKYLCKEYLPSVNRVVLSTATPYVRSAEDLHSLYSVMEPGQWQTLGTFRKKFCRWKPNPFAKYPGAKIWYGFRSETADELHERGSKFTFFRRKHDVLDQLPEKLETDLELYAPAEHQLHNIDKEQEYDLATGTFTGGLREILSKELQALGLWKVKAAVTFVEDVERGRAIVVFCRHRLVAQKLQEELKKTLSEPVRVITGETSNDKRRQIIEDFTDEKFRVLVATIGSSGTGINLQRANLALFVELPWSYTELKQCEDRLHRIGQKTAVNIYRMYAKNTLDDLVVRQINQKFEGEEQTIGGWE